MRFVERSTIQEFVFSIIVRTQHCSLARRRGRHTSRESQVTHVHVHVGRGVALNAWPKKDKFTGTEIQHKGSITRTRYISAKIQNNGGKG